MLKFVGKDGKTLMEMTDAGDVAIYDAKLAGAGILKEKTEQEGDKKDGSDDQCE